MKFDTQKAFPYPVLRPYNDDYLESEFQASVAELSVKGERIKLKISYALSSKEILDLINKKMAKYVSIISCRETYSRNVLSSYRPEIASEFNINEFRGETKIDSFIIAENEIVSFKSAEINPEFGSGPFSFGIGAVLAQDTPDIYYIDRDVFRPVSTVFDLVKDDSLDDREWSIGFDDNHVQIKVSKNIKSLIDIARSSVKKQAILINSIYFSTVMQAIYQLNNYIDDYGDYKWAKVFQQRAQNLGCNLKKDDLFLSAQILLDYPLSLLNEYQFKEEDS